MPKKKTAKIISELVVNGAMFHRKYLKPAPYNADDYYNDREKLTEVWLRHWQIPAFNLLKNERYTITNVFMGGGKTIFLQRLVLEKLRQNPRAKVIIIVPRLDIGQSLERSIRIDGLEFEVDVQLCQDEGKVKNIQFRRFCQSPASGVLVCSHATFALNYEDIINSEIPCVDENVHLFVDEAHHVSSDDFQKNNLGHALEIFYERGCGIHLLTATFHRGDGYNIINKSILDQFITYSLPIHEYLAKYVTSFDTFDYRLVYAENCDVPGSYVDLVVQLCLRDGKKFKNTVIWQPFPRVSGTLTTVASKVSEAYKIIEGISGLPQKTWESSLDEDGVYTAGDLRFLLLTEDNDSIRNIRRSYLSSGKMDVNYIITIGMCKEGTNWVGAERGIIIGPRNSMPDLTQMMGRVLRDWPGKIKEPEIIQLIPIPSYKKTTDEEYREHANSVYNSWMLAITMDIITNPIQLFKNDGSGEPRDRTSYPLLMCRNKVEDLNQVCEKLGKIFFNARGYFKDFEKEAIKFLEKEGYTEYIEESIETLWRRFGNVAFNSLRKKDLGNYENIDFIQDINLTDFGQMMNAGFGKDAFINAMQIWGQFASLEEHIKWAKDHNIKNCQQWRKSSTLPEFKEKRLYTIITYSPFTKEDLVLVMPNYKEQPVIDKIEKWREYEKIAKKMKISGPKTWRDACRAGKISKDFYFDLYKIFSSKEISKIFPDMVIRNVLVNNSLIVDQWKENLTLKEIAEKNGYPVSTVRNALIKGGHHVPIKRQPSKINTYLTNQNSSYAINN